jgi:hypothetical protein
MLLHVVTARFNLTLILIFVEKIICNTKAFFRPTDEDKQVYTKRFPYLQIPFPRGAAQNAGKKNERECFPYIPIQCPCISFLFFHP